MEVHIRLDKFLKETRIIPRRVIAKETIDNGNVLVNEKTAKPSTLLKDGDFLKIYIRGIALHVKVEVDTTGRRPLVKAIIVDRRSEDIPTC